MTGHGTGSVEAADMMLYRNADENETMCRGAHGWMAPRLRPLIHGIMIVHRTSSLAIAKVSASFSLQSCSGGTRGEITETNQPDVINKTSLYNSSGTTSLYLQILRI